LIINIWSKNKYFSWVINSNWMSRSSRYCNYIF